MQPIRGLGRAICLCTLVLVFSPFPDPTKAAGYVEMQQKRPDLFHAETGYRVSKQRGPTPDDIPAPVTVIDTLAARELVANGAVAIDVFGARQSRYDELDGTWLVSKTHFSLPGAVWLPETGRGTLTAEMQRYLEANLVRLTSGNRATPIVVFCVADCWMSWNASQRISRLGYENVYWFRLGTDGWREQGLPLEPATPVPVDVD